LLIYRFCNLFRHFSAVAAVVVVIEAVVYVVPAYGNLCRFCSASFHAATFVVVVVYVPFSAMPSRLYATNTNLHYLKNANL
jgi:hypothetical protein